MASPAQYHCTNAGCGALWSADQLVQERFGDEVVLLCPRCRLGVEELVAEPKFWERVPTAFRYPFQQDGPWMLFGGTIFLTLLNLGRQIGFWLGTLIALVILTGYFGMLLLQVVQTAGSDDRRGLEWPELTGFGEMAGTFFRIIGSLAIVFGPAIFCGVHSINEAVSGDARSLFLGWTALALAAGFLGLLYYPMAFLGLAMFDSLSGVNPFAVLPAIWKTRRPYLLVLVLLAVLSFLGRSIAALAGLLPWWGRLIVALPVGTVVLYTAIVSARLLGLLYRSNRRRIGWFT